MPTIELWIQLEAHAWDICPSGKDRMTGLTVDQLVGGKPPVNVTLRSPVTGVTRTVKMFQPVRDSDGDVAEALILRNYTPNWAAPDDRKVNPWDVNERDPSDNGTMGTIPGKVIECSVGDTVIVHFRNMDMRSRPLFKLTQAVAAKGVAMQMLSAGTMAGMGGGGGGMGGMEAMPAEQAQATPAQQQAQRLVATPNINIGDINKIPIPFPFFVPLPVLQRTHSMHTHGFVFAPTSDGAYPLTPIDTTQPVGAEAALWASVGVTGGFKQGDRVPPGGTFTYTWNTLGWPTTQGCWLYHDHSVCDTENVTLGAIGIVMIHPQPGDPAKDADVEQDVDIRLPNGQLDPAFLPGGSPIGSPISVTCFPLTKEFQMAVLPQHLENLGLHATLSHMPGMSMPMETGQDAPAPSAATRHGGTHPAPTGGGGHEPTPAPGGGKPPALEAARALMFGDAVMQLDDNLATIIGFCLPRYRTPPSKALYLQLYHEFANIGMSVNGRKYLGNTPTVLAGPTTKMKFGVVGMGSMAHTFHIHGHRWLIPGPGLGGTQGLQFGSRMDTPVSQFEDTRVFGPANSFSFTINEGSSFMRASPAIGEWHMHCHVLAHMMDGMMGSLFIVNGGELAFALPSGKPCPTMPLNDGTPPPPDGTGPKTVNISIVNGGPAGFQFSPGNAVAAAGDTLKFTNNSGDIHQVVWDTTGSPANSPIISTPGGTWSIAVPNPGTFNYHCGVHPAMTASVTVS